MHTDKLLHTLADARREVQAIRPDPSLGPHPGGLTFTRAAYLAADPRHWTAGAHGHADGRRLCARLAERLRGLVHPSWSALADHAAGRLDARAARLLTEHTAQCGGCARRLADMKSKRDGVLRLEQPCPLPCPAAGRPPVELTSADRRWQALLSEDGGAEGRLVLEVRTREVPPSRRLVGVRLRGAGGHERTRFLVLREDGEALRARAAFDLCTLREALGARLEDAVVLALDATQLTAEDRVALLESLPGPEGDGRERAAWCAWLGEAGQERALADEVRRLLHEAPRRLS